MTGTTTSTQFEITLKGSVDIITEFFDYAINSILYQRGIYAPETFTQVQQYGLTVLMTTDDELKIFITNVLKQLQDWIMQKWVRRVVVIIVDMNTKETLERWEFNIEHEVIATGEKSSKNIKEIQKEIKGIIRQITSSVTFLPLIDVPCSFDVLIYTDGIESDVPEDWSETTGHLIPNSECVSFKNFSTGIHKVSAAVYYKTDDL